MYSSTLSLTSALDGVSCQRRSGQMRKISPPTGIRSPDQTVRSDSLYRRVIPAHGGKWHSLLRVVRCRHSCRDPQQITPFLLAHHHMGSVFFQGCTSDVYSDTSKTFSCIKNCLCVLESIPFSLSSSSLPYSQDIVHRNTVAQRFSNCGPRTTSGPRVLPLWSF